MASVVDIANRALDKLGHGTITSLADNNTTASLCNRTWEFVRDQVLREHPWNFAVKRVTLAPLSAAPDWGFTYQHQLPSDLLRILEVRDLSTDEYQIEDNKIMADEDTLYVRYIKQVTDPNEYDALFIDAVASRMAYEMCESLTQSNSKRQLAWEEYMEAMVSARRVDAQENPAGVFEEDSWIEARY